MIHKAVLQSKALTKGKDVVAACKTMRSSTKGSKGAVLAFLKEAALMGQFLHPCVVQLLGVVRNVAIFASTSFLLDCPGSPFPPKIHYIVRRMVVWGSALGDHGVWRETLPWHGQLASGYASAKRIQDGLSDGLPDSCARGDDGVLGSRPKAADCV